MRYVRLSTREKAGLFSPDQHSLTGTGGIAVAQDGYKTEKVDRVPAEGGKIHRFGLPCMAERVSLFHAPRQVPESGISQCNRIFEMKPGCFFPDGGFSGSFQITVV